MTGISCHEFLQFVKVTTLHRQLTPHETPSLRPCDSKENYKDRQRATLHVHL